MKIKHLICSIVCIAFFICSSEAQIFDVVVKTPLENSFSYSGTMPEIKEKYITIGAAFFMKDGLFYSAAHLFNLYTESVYTEYFIRSKNNEIYKVSGLKKISTEKDVIAFTASVPEVSGVAETLGTLKNYVPKEKEALIPSSVQVSQEALTAFKAEVKIPGAPVLNEKKEVVGMITDVDDERDTCKIIKYSDMRNMPLDSGIIKSSVVFHYANVAEENTTRVFSYSLRLPLLLSDVRKILIEKYADFIKTASESIKMSYVPVSAKGFLKGSGSADILSSSSVPSFPYTISMLNKKKWGFYLPQALETKDFPDGSSVLFGGMNGCTHALITKPADMDFETLVTSPDIYMDLLLSAAGIKRKVAGVSFEFTSFGEPDSSDIYVDYFKRTWFVSFWHLTFMDAVAVTYVLPLPQGLYVIMDIDSTGAVYSTSLPEMRFACDCVYPRYAATLKSWKEFLETMEKYGGLCKPLDSFEISYDKNEFSFNSDTMKLKIPSSVFSVDENAVMRISLGYKVKASKSSYGDSATMEHRGIDLFNDRASEKYTYVYFDKSPKPSSSAQNSSVQVWNQKCNKEFPYIGEPYVLELYTFYDETLYPENKSEMSDADYVVSMSCELKGIDKGEDMKKFVKDIKKGFFLK